MADFQTTTLPKARKARRCPECGGTIQAGERYARIAGSYDGDFFSAIQCEPCRAFGDRYLESLDLCAYLNWDEKTFQYGSLLDEAAEHFGITRAEDRDKRTWAQLRDEMMAQFDAHDEAEREQQKLDREQIKAAQARVAARASLSAEADGKRYRDMSPTPSPGA